jgi:molybdopterin-biosynthesis enzyme MoeA-like protein
VQTVQVRVLPDSVLEVAEAVRVLSQKVSYVFTTGGIGPTHDDITLEAVAQGLDVVCVPHPVLQQHVGPYASALTPVMLHRYVSAPQGCEVLWDAHNQTPVFCVQNVYVLAGVPSFVRKGFAMLAPRLKGRPFYSETLFLNVSEPVLAEALSDVQKRFSLVAIGSYPRFDGQGYRLKITLDGHCKESVQEAYREVKALCDPSWWVEHI